VNPVRADVGAFTNTLPHRQKYLLLVVGLLRRLLELRGSDGRFRPVDYEGRGCGGLRSLH
jgi:hypothetical protein